MVTFAADSADVVAVNVAVTVAVTSLVTPPGAPDPTVVCVVNCGVMLLTPALAVDSPWQPGTELIVKTSPALFVVEVSSTAAGGVILRPAI